MNSINEVSLSARNETHRTLFLDFGVKLVQARVKAGFVFIDQR